MTNILKHTGSNIGGINPIQFIHAEEVSIISYNETDLTVSITLKSGKTWSYLYGTDGTIMIDHKEEESDAGLQHTYTIQFLVPKNRQDISSTLENNKGRPLIIKLQDKNGMIRLFGEIDNPMRLTSRELNPANVEEYDGYEVKIFGTFSHPAGYIQEDPGGIPDQPPNED
jgi:hypothetical protein